MTSHPRCEPDAADPPTLTTPAAGTLLATLRKQGFVILRSLLSPPRVSRLRTAASHLAGVARSGGWPHLRTLPKQFPPWPADAALGIWGVQHLLHPACPGRDVFAELYFSREMLHVVREIVEVEVDGHHADDAAFKGRTDGSSECIDGESGTLHEDGLVMELLNLLVTPTRDFELRWHRDSVPFDVPVGREAELLGLNSPAARAASSMASPGFAKGRYGHTQYNVPLLPTDSSLHLVPGSHVRARTEAELAALARDPLSAPLPGAVEVVLQPGDVCFYDNDIIHRGVYHSNAERMTLHGSVGDARAGDRRAKGVLQHGVGDWVGSAEASFLRRDCDDRGEDAEDERWRVRAEGMRRRLVDLGLRNQGDDVRQGVFGGE